MRKKSVKIRWILFLTAVVFSVGIGGSYAYYTSGSKVQNQLITKGSEVFLQELFHKEDQWLPGETKQKKVHFGNQSPQDQVIRFQVIEVWYDNQGTPENLADDVPWSPVGTYTPAPAVINWTSEVTGGTWVKKGQWYYYTKVLKGSSGGSATKTPDIISSVTFSSEISNAGPGAVDDFSNKRYSLTVQMESLDVNPSMTTEAWHMNFIDNSGVLTWNPVP